MTEEELNESIIKDKIKGICQDCIYLDKIVPIINQMLKEEYIKGLEQGKLDKELEKQQLISFLEDKIKEYVDRREELAKNIGYGDEYDFGLNILKITNKLQAYREVLDFVRGDKNE